jgi:D-arabinose 1-dehydrogenase-like Zn-dependent alcohol dehydrogenase
MRTRVLYTDGKGKFVETIYDKPDCGENEIVVKALMTGVCRSDIDMMQGNFGPLPINMSGHEGIGEVMIVGANVNDISIGDYVATRGEPAYADYYNVRDGEFVKIPEAHPRYILEPVACGMNVVRQASKEIEARSGPGKKLLILGSGFLAWVAYHTLKIEGYDIEVDVVGSSNQNIWGDILLLGTTEKYDVVIDLSGKDDVFNGDLLNEGALIIMGAQKKVTTDFGNLLWKACTMIFPSPRNPDFLYAMKRAEYWITSGKLNVDYFWTRSYNRNTEWQQAFDDGLNRPNNYSRGYIVW